MATPTDNQSARFVPARSADAAALAKLYDLDSRGGQAEEVAAVRTGLLSLGYTPLVSQYGAVLDAAGGYQTDNGLGGPDSGGYAFTAKRLHGDTLEFAISFAGTDFWDSADRQTDFATWGFTAAYKQLRPALVEMLAQAATAQALHLENPAENPAVRILITGHSLGGALAQAALLDLLIPRPD